MAGARPVAGTGALPGYIEIRGLRVLGTHGVLPEERTRPQPFEVDVDLELDMATAAAGDDLAGTVNYALVVDHVVALVGGDHAYDLLEALAGRLAADALGLDDRVVAVTVAIRKLQPPLPADLASVGVRLSRRR